MTQDWENLLVPRDCNDCRELLNESNDINSDPKAMQAWRDRIEGHLRYQHPPNRIVDR
jgi:hypothetical protein